MLLTREQAEAREQQMLASYAVKSGQSRGRAHEETEGPYRTCFQRDRDRVIHSKAFRRLKGKTQVFVAHYGDHYRSRLVHSMEVAQLSRDVARMLNLNEDLAETIALAHDLGHTPFGHAGQDEMHELMQQFGGRFEHNEQSRRIVEFLEEKHSGFPGLNLSFEVQDGLLKHRTTYDKPQTTDTLMPSLEAQIVNMADEIAYQNHDIDDVLRSGILKIEDFEHLDIWHVAKKNVDSGLPFDLWTMAMVSSLVSLMVNDLAEEVEKRLKKYAVQTVDQIYNTSDDLAGFSADMLTMTTALKQFLYHRFYQSEGVAEYNNKGKVVIRRLFNYFMEDPNRIPSEFRQRFPEEKEFVLVKDYIAGMTDNFALEIYNKIA